MRSWRFVVALVVSLVVLFQGVVPANAAEVPVAPFVASDYLSGLAQARLRDHRVLVTSLLSEESTTWVNADGTLTTDSFGSPVRVKETEEVLNFAGKIWTRGGAKGKYVPGG